MPGAVKDLRVLRTRVQANVVVGENQWGGDITVLVELDRSAEDVQKAFKPLHFLFTEAADALVNEAAVAKRVREGIDKKVKDTIAKERERIETNAKHESQRQLDELRREITGLKSDKKWREGELSRERETTTRLNQQVSQQAQTIADLHRTRLEAAQADVPSSGEAS